MSAKSIWQFDVNRRVYLDGRSGPSYRHHWHKVNVVGETTVSWILSSGKKVKKSNTFSDSDVEDQIYIHDNKYKIADLVQRIDDADILRAVDAIVRPNPSDQRAGASPAPLHQVVGWVFHHATVNAIP